MTIRLTTGEELDGCEELSDGNFMTDAGWRHRDCVACIVTYPAWNNGRPVTVPLSRAPAGPAARLNPNTEPTMTTTANRQRITYLAVALGYWGRGATEAAAIARCREAGASKRDKTIVYKIHDDDPNCEAPFVTVQGVIVSYGIPAKIAVFENASETFRA